MRKIAFGVLAAATGCLVGFQFAGKSAALEAGTPGAGAVAIPGQVGGEDMFGAYEVVKGWPKNISTLPGNEKWTWGAGQSIYAESPDRIYVLQRGELPNIPRPH